MTVNPFCGESVTAIEGMREAVFGVTLRALRSRPRYAGRLEPCNLSLAQRARPFHRRERPEGCLTTELA